MRAKLSSSFCALALAAALAGCGSSSSSSASQATSSTSTTSSSSATSTSSTGAPTSTTSSSAATGGSATVTTGPVRGTLTASNHTPIAGKPWLYSVTVTDAAGHPLSGTVDIEFLFSGTVVGHDTPPVHPLKNGHWHDNLEFPAMSVGYPLTFRAAVKTSAGSINLDWPVEVQK